MTKISLAPQATVADLSGSLQLIGYDTTAPAGSNVKRVSPADLQSAIASKPKWKKVTSFRNNWSEQAPETLGNLAYCLDSQGFVHIEGVIKGGAANTVAFVIDDISYRPPLMKTRYGNEASGGKAGVVVNTDGTVAIYTSSTYAVGQWVAIDISYPINQVFF